MSVLHVGVELGKYTLMTVAKKSSVLGLKMLNSLSRDKSLANPSRLKSTVLNALTNSMTFKERTPKLKCIPSYTSSGENTSVLVVCAAFSNFGVM